MFKKNFRFVDGNVIKGFTHETGPLTEEEFTKYFSEMALLRTANHLLS